MSLSISVYTTEKQNLLIDVSIEYDSSNMVSEWGVAPPMFALLL